MMETPTYDSWICGIIVLISIVGLVAWWASLYAINKEGRGLQRCKNDFHALASLIDKWLESPSSPKPQSAEKIGGKWGGDYVSNRIYCIFCAVDPRRMVRRTPPLSDLREITVQEEQSSWYVSCLRFITPCVLVLGILGTLIGVHEQMGAAQKTLEEGGDALGCMAHALVPGQLAVFCTILLMVVRGVYSHMWSEYIKQLDEFTIQRVLPHFSQQSDLEGNCSEMVACLQAIEDSSSKFQAVVERISNLGAAGAAEEAAQNLARISTELPKLGSLCADLTSIIESESQRNDGMLALHASLLQDLHKFSKSVLEVSLHVSDAQSELDNQFIPRQTMLGQVCAYGVRIGKMKEKFALRCKSYIEAVEKLKVFYLQWDKSSMDDLEACTGRLAAGTADMPQRVQTLESRVGKMPGYREYAAEISSWFIRQGQGMSKSCQEFKELLEKCADALEQQKLGVNQASNDHISNMRAISAYGEGVIKPISWWRGVWNRFLNLLHWLFRGKSGGFTLMLILLATIIVLLCIYAPFVISFLFFLYKYVFFS